MHRLIEIFIIVVAPYDRMDIAAFNANESNSSCSITLLAPAQEIGAAYSVEIAAIRTWK